MQTYAICLCIIINVYIYVCVSQWEAKLRKNRRRSPISLSRRKKLNKALYTGTPALKLARVWRGACWWHHWCWLQRGWVMTTVCTCASVCFLLANNATAVWVHAVMRPRLSLWYDADLCHLPCCRYTGQTGRPMLSQRLAREEPPADSGFPLSIACVKDSRQSALSINKLHFMSWDIEAQIPDKLSSTCY